jgi:hypothetical protein
MRCDYECTKSLTKWLMILSSAALVALGIGRFFTFVGVVDPIQYILNIYFM